MRCSLATGRFGLLVATALTLLLATGLRQPAGGWRPTSLYCGALEEPAALPPLLLQRVFTDYRVVESTLQMLLLEQGGKACVVNNKLLMVLMRKISYCNFPVARIVHWFNFFVSTHGIDASAAEIRMFLAKLSSSLARIKASPSFDRAKGGLSGAANAAIALVGAKTRRERWSPVIYNHFLELFYYTDRVLIGKDIRSLLKIGKDEGLVSDASVTILLNLAADAKNAPSCDLSAVTFVFNHLSNLGAADSDSLDKRIRPLSSRSSSKAVSRMLALLLALPGVEERVIHAFIDDIDACGLADLEISLMVMAPHPSRRNSSMDTAFAVAKSLARNKSSGAAHSPLFLRCTREYVDFLIWQGRGAAALEVVSFDIARTIDAPCDDGEPRLSRDVIAGYVDSCIRARAQRGGEADDMAALGSLIEDVARVVRGSSTLQGSGAAASARQWALHAALGAYYTTEGYDRVLQAFLQFGGGGSSGVARSPQESEEAAAAAAALLDSDSALGMLLSSLKKYLVYLYSGSPGDIGVNAVWTTLRAAVARKYLSGPAVAPSPNALKAVGSAIDCSSKFDDFDTASRLFERFSSAGGPRLRHAYLRAFRSPSQAWLLQRAIAEHALAGAPDSRMVDELIFALRRTGHELPDTLAYVERAMAGGAIASCVALRALAGSLAEFWRSYDRDDPDAGSGRSLREEMGSVLRCTAAGAAAARSGACEASLALLVSVPLCRGNFACAAETLAAAAGSLEGGALRQALVLELAVVLALSPSVNVYNDATMAAVSGGKAEDSLSGIVGALPDTSAGRRAAEELPSITLLDAVVFLELLCSGDAKPAVGARLLNRLFNDAINSRKYSQGARVVRVLERSRLVLDMSPAALATVGATSHDSHAVKSELARTYAALLVGKSLRFLKSDIKQSILSMQRGLAGGGGE